MVLLILAVGLLTLSSITLRSAGRDGARAIARANARMALVIAVGELQRLAGADTRITATADVLDADSASSTSEEVRATGVWRSWEGLDRENEKPVAPDYSLKFVAGRNGVSGGTGGRFLGWLASESQRQADPANPPSLAAGEGKVALVGEESVGSAAGGNRQVHLTPVPVPHGAYAWWIGGQNAKANIGRLEPDQETAVDWKDSMASHAVADPQIVSVHFTGNKEETVPKLASFGTLDPASGSEDARRNHFHSLATYSRGLLTDVVKGGWKKDLSLMVETYPSAIGSPGRETLLYPWAKLRTGGVDPFAKVGAITSWGALVDYATQYKQITSGTASGRVVMPFTGGQILNSSENDIFLNKVSRMPVVASAQFVLAHSSMPNATDKTKFDAALTINPVLTLWNPWNVEITTKDISFLIRKSPLSFTYTLVSSLDQSEKEYKPFNLSDLSVTLKMKVSQSITLKPGETRVFSPAATGSFTAYAKNSEMTLAPGYQTRGGFQLRIDPLITGSGTDMLRVKMKVNDVVGYVGADSSTGAYIDVNANGDVWRAAHRMVFTPQVAANYYPNLDNLTSVTLGQVRDRQNEVFATAMMSLRSVNDSAFPSRGFDQNNPIALYSELGLQGGLAPGQTGTEFYRGSQHPVNSPFDLRYRGVTGWNDTNLPAASGTLGYILTSSAADKGINRCVAAELPLRPLRSLGELQHFQARGQNPYPPFKLNIIGNSVASPLAPPDSVFIPMAGGDSKMQHDDSYCLNQLLFDSYFFSSIAPDTADWTKTVKRSLEDVYRDHLNGAEPLPNRAYLATREAAAPDVQAAMTRDLTGVKNKAWKTIASRLEVDGMFNVNSTSVDAWKAFLSHARGARIPQIDVSSNSWSVSLGDERNHPVSRTTVAGAGLADGDLSGYDRFTGYRDLTDDQITALATGIVSQIRQRGPALSLAEFVNRQLRGGTKVDLALGGVIQAALDQLARSTSQNPFADLQGMSQEITAANLPGKEAEYLFPKAAQGWTGEGLPGWITQADILRPLAPVLSVRDDTFIIRAYGEARDVNGTTEARAWCEAVVSRRGEFVAPSAGVDPVSDDNLTKGNGKDLNAAFGRRFEIVSFRFLNPDEI